MSDSPARPWRAAGPDIESVAALAAVLWQERELLETVLFRLVELQHLLAAGAIRWLPKACAEVTVAANAVQGFELLRAVEVDVLSRQTGLAPDVALTALAESAPEPWPALLLEHRDALRNLALEIDAVAAENRRLGLVGEQATRDALHRATAGSGGVDPGDGGYPDAGGRMLRHHDAARILDQRA